MQIKSPPLHTAREKEGENVRRKIAFFHILFFLQSWEQRWERWETVKKHAVEKLKSKAQLNAKYIP